MKIEYRVFRIKKYTEGFRIEAVPAHPHDAETKSTPGEQFPEKLAEFLEAMGTGGWQIQPLLTIPGMDQQKKDGLFLIFTKPA